MKRWFCIIMVVQMLFIGLLVAHDVFDWKSDWTVRTGVNIWLPLTYLVVGVSLTVVFFLWMVERMTIGRPAMYQNLFLLACGIGWSAFDLMRWVSMPELEFAPVAILCLYLMCAILLVFSQTYILVKPSATRLK